MKSAGYDTHHCEKCNVLRIPKMRAESFYEAWIKAFYRGWPRYSKSTEMMFSAGTCSGCAVVVAFTRWVRLRNMLYGMKAFSLSMTEIGEMEISMVEKLFETVNHGRRL